MLFYRLQYLSKVCIDKILDFALQKYHDILLESYLIHCFLILIYVSRNFLCIFFAICHILFYCKFVVNPKWWELYDLKLKTSNNRYECFNYRFKNSMLCYIWINVRINLSRFFFVLQWTWKEEKMIFILKALLLLLLRII